MEKFFAHDKTPVFSIAYEAHVTERLLGATGFPLHARKQVGELNKVLTVSLSHMNRKDEDTGDVVERAGPFLFREVAYKVTAIVIVLGHDVEQKRLHVVVQSFRTQKELRKKTKVLAVNRVLTAVDFKE